MKPLVLVTLGASVVSGLAGCATGSGPNTAWGKEGVSMMDYRTDSGQCAVLAATATPEKSGSNTAGGIDGHNTVDPPKTGGEAAVANGTATGVPSAPSGDARPTGGGMYQDMANSDYVQRAATQQRAQEMAIQRARADSLRSCLATRGYTEFALTPEQKQELATLKQGSDERREYLYKLGTDPQVLKSQAVPKKGS